MELHGYKNIGEIARKNCSSNSFSENLSTDDLKRREIN